MLAYNLAPIVISIVALAVSAYSAYRTWCFYNSSIRASARQEHGALVRELDRHMIEKPELWAIYDNNPVCQITPRSPTTVARLEGFLYLHFSVFDLVHSFYHESIRRNAMDDANWQAWVRYFRQLFRESSHARRLFSEPRTLELYSEGFVSFAQDLIRDVEEAVKDGSELERAEPSVTDYPPNCGTSKPKARRRYRHGRRGGKRALR